MIKLTDILLEIGDSSIKPYSFEFYGDDDDEIRYYGFDTKNYPYSVKITQHLDNSGDLGNEIDIEFYVPDEEDPDLDRWNIETNKGDMFKIMATVAAIVKEDTQKHPEIDTLSFTPVKKQGKSDNNARSNLYLRYVKHEYPNATVERHGNEIVVKLK
jgi:hypothetical protein